METKIVRVSGTSNVSRTAGAIAKMIRGGCSVTVQSLGTAATIRAVKAITLACQYLLEDKIVALFYPEFMWADEVEEDGLSGIRFNLAVLSTIATIEIPVDASGMDLGLDPDVMATLQALLRTKWKQEPGQKPPVDESGWDMGLN